MTTTEEMPTKTEVKKPTLKLLHKFFKFATLEGKPYEYNNKEKIFIMVNGENTGITLGSMFVPTFLTPSFEETKWDGFSILQFLDTKTDTMKIDFNGQVKTVKVQLWDSVQEKVFKFGSIVDLTIPFSSETLDQKQIDKFLSLLFKDKKEATGATLVPVPTKEAKIEEEEKMVEEEKMKSEAKAKEEAEAKEKAEAKAKEESEAKEKAEAKAKEEAEAKAKEEAEAKAKAKEEAEAKAAEIKAKNDIAHEEYKEYKEASEEEGLKEYKNGDYRFFYGEDGDALVKTSEVEGVWSWEEVETDVIEDESDPDETMIYSFFEGDKPMTLTFDVKSKKFSVQKA